MVWTETGWSIIILFVIVFLYELIIIKNKDPIIGLVAIWVFIAILVK